MRDEWEETDESERDSEVKAEGMKQSGFGM
jgi:hypothetical protein